MSQMLSLSFFITLLAISQSVEIDIVQSEQYLVTISQGTVAGFQSEDGSYFEFHGIPYADSTSGRNRFKAPLPPPSFSDIFVANRKNVKCVRALTVGYEGTEDCLVANVFTPTLNSRQQLPVMVWIKGNEFDRKEERQLTFKHLIDKEVVIVTLNFRESILGYLCLGTETAPGNAGLKDIIAGLQWVKDNIARFGGDPNRVTLFGHGSGAASVDLITLSPMAEGLVQRAIAQSGTAFAPWAVSRDNIQHAVEVAEALGHIVTDIEQVSEIFTRTSIAALMGIIHELDLTDNSLAFAPCIENESLEVVRPFLTKSPHDIISQGEFLQIPMMIGFVDNEGTIRTEEILEDDWLERMDTEFSNFIQSDLKFENEEEEIELVQEIKQFYFGDSPINEANIDKLISYQGDTMILVSAIREARMRVDSSISNVYLYQFSYKGSLGESFVGPSLVDGATHSEELAYLFHSTGTQPRLEIDLTVADILIERWTNFAKTSEPTSETSQVEWYPFTSNNNFYLRVLNSDELNDADSTFEIALQNPHPATIEFWNQIYENHFLDAESSWKITPREDEEEDVTVEEDNDEDDDEDNGEGEEDSGDGEEGEPDSASTAVGYTFIIITLFTVLNLFHSSQILSETKY